MRTPSSVMLITSSSAASERRKPIIIAARRFSAFDGFRKQYVAGAISDAAFQAVIDKALHGRNLVVVLLILANQIAHIVARIGLAPAFGLRFDPIFHSVGYLPSEDALTDGIFQLYRSFKPTCAIGENLCRHHQQ